LGFKPAIGGTDTVELKHAAGSYAFCIEFL